MSRNILGGLVLPDFKAIGGKTMWYWCRARGIIGESLESSETDPVYNGHLVYRQMVVKLVIHMGKNTIESLSLAMYNIHPEVGYRIKYKRKH